jgi:negative regulator of sigma-B (phosphoserine phosphatase)
VAAVITNAGGGAHIDWATAGRPLSGETVSGDTAVHVELDGVDVIAVVDGLGHGPEAAAAALRACEIVEAHATEPIDLVFRKCHDALLRTRGVAMTIASIGPNGTMHWLAVGNVDAVVMRLEDTRLRRAGTAVLWGGVVGYRLPKLRVSTFELAEGDLVLMATDGVAPDFVDDLVIGDPVDRLATTIIDRYARPNDDALVAAARFRGGT